MRLVVAAFLALSAFVAAQSIAYQDHIWPPLLPGLCGQNVSVCPTPLIIKAKERGVVTYRLDAGTASYPNFRQQASAVANAWRNALGVEAQEITAGTPDIWLTFPDDPTFASICSTGAAACIQYWADPVMVYFRRALFYDDWKTTVSHEGLNGGHALGLHERYDDRNFICIANPQPPSVMSCGSGIWQPQPFDLEWTCAVIDPDGALFTGCGLAPPQGAVLEPAFCRDGRAVVELGWSAPVGVVELLYLDLSVTDNGFAPGTFLGLSLDTEVRSVLAGGPGPLGPLRAATEHHWRINARIEGRWYASETGAFMTPDCSN